MAARIATVVIVFACLAGLWWKGRHEKNIKAVMLIDGLVALFVLVMVFWAASR